MSDEEEEYEYSSVEEEEEGNNEGAGSGYTRSDAPCAAPSDFRVIEEDELMAEQRRVADEVSHVLDIPLASAGVLLRHFNWNKEKLFDKYYADPEDTRIKSGIQFATTSADVLSPNQNVVCQICCDDYPANQTFGMGCNHRFCLDCWAPYLENKVNEGPTSVFTTCPAYSCGEVVNEDVFNQLTDPAARQKYSRFVLRSFVDINRSIKWCPSPQCSKAVSAPGYTGVVQCGCGYNWCFKCTEEAHKPVLCESLALWLEKCRNESETANWILANTRMCPRCSVRIEKNQGCNHMTCRNCQFEFCWICFGNWAEHGAATGGYYKCNRFDASKEVPDTDAAKAKAELDRYLHYYRRYANHDQAGKFAARQRAITERRMVELQESNSGSNWIDVQFLRSATEQLIECRRVLKFTYVFAYYLTDQKEKDLFEYLQENLEKNTEHLAELVEMRLEAVDRSAVVNFTRVTQRFLKNLLEGVDEGLTREVETYDHH